MSQRLALLTAVLVLTAACTDHPTSELSRPSAEIFDGASGGNGHFFFLQPLVPNPGPGAGNDASLSPSVEICDWDGVSCGTILATYTTDLATTTTTHAGNSETVRLGTGHFIVNWHTEFFPLDPSRTYRICVKVGDVELGFADVDVAASGRELRLAADGYVTVLDGRTLPIVFRIEPGALEDPGAGNCGSQPV
jgi:hypothetical protein